MRIHVIYAHPMADSYAAARLAAVLEGLRAGGHEVDLLDLYAERFDPVLSEPGRRLYRDVPANLAGVERYVERLRRAEGVIVVFPSWWYGMPAILKGYFDRVWLPGVAFEFGPQAIRPLLGHIRLFGVVTTTGAPGWFTRLYVGNPSRKVLMRGLSRLASPKAERFWLAHYGVDRSTPEDRARHIRAVKDRIARIRP